MMTRIYPLVLTFLLFTNHVLALDISAVLSKCQQHKIPFEFNSNGDINVSLYWMSHSSGPTPVLSPASLNAFTFGVLLEMKTGSATLELQNKSHDHTTTGYQFKMKGSSKSTGTMVITFKNWPKKHKQLSFIGSMNQSQKRGREEVLSATLDGSQSESTSGQLSQQDSYQLIQLQDEVERANQIREAQNELISWCARLADFKGEYTERLRTQTNRHLSILNIDGINTISLPRRLKNILKEVEANKSRLTMPVIERINQLFGFNIQPVKRRCISSLSTQSTLSQSIGYSLSTEYSLEADDGTTDGVFENLITALRESTQKGHDLSQIYQSELVERIKNITKNEPAYDVIKNLTIIVKQFTDKTRGYRPSNAVIIEIVRTVMELNIPGQQKVQVVKALRQLIALQSLEVRMTINKISTNLIPELIDLDKMKEKDIRDLFAGFDSVYDQILLYKNYKDVMPKDLIVKLFAGAYTSKCTKFLSAHQEVLSSLPKKLAQKIESLLYNSAEKKQAA